MEEEGLLWKERGEREREVRRNRWTSRVWVQEMSEEGVRLWYIAGPMVLVTVSQYMLQVISMMMVGHISELSLSSAAIATSLTGVFGFSLLLGMASALETLCGQAYGAKEYQKLGIQTYRAIFSLLLVCVPLSFLWASMGKLLSLIGIDPLISREAGRYVMWMIPGLFAYAVSQPLVKFLQSQSLILPMMLGTLATLCLHVPLCWFLVFKSGLSNVGAALASSISNWVNLIILGLYVKYSVSCKETRAPISKEAFQGINEFLRLAIPSAVMICLEWWSFELLVLLSGFLPNAKLETSVLFICLTTMSLLYCIPMGFGAAASTRVSNELGAGNPQGACLAVRVAMFLAAMEAAIVGFSLFVLRNYWGYAYSSEKEVIDYVHSIAPLLCLSVIMDALQGVLSGIARGAGWQHLGAYVNFGSFYLIGIPIAAVLGFLVHLNGKGLWIGILVGATVQTCILFLITSFTNWQQQANRARERLFQEKLTVSDIS